MDRAGFRDYVFPLDHPRVARLKGKDAHAHAQIARGDPRAQELLIEPWSRLINTEIYFFVYGLRMDEIRDGPAADALRPRAPRAPPRGLTALPGSRGQPVETPGLGFEREDFHTAEACLARVAAERGRTHHGPGGGCTGIPHRARQA